MQYYAEHTLAKLQSSLEVIIKHHDRKEVEIMTQLAMTSSSTIQLTGNVAGTRTTRHASTQETRKGTRSPRGIASKTKTTRGLNYSQFTRETSFKGPGTIMIQPVHKIHVTEHSDMQLQHICTLY